MFNYIYRKSTLQIFLLAAIVIFAIVRLVFAPVIFIAPDSTGFLYPSLYGLLFPHPIATRITLGIGFAIQLALIQHFISKNNFLDSSSFMPAILILFFLITTSNFPTFSPAAVTNFLLLTLLEFNIADSKKNNNSLFFSGLTVAVATLFEPAAILMLPIIFAALFVSKANVLKRICLALTGFALPLIYLLSYHFLTDKMQVINDYFTATVFPGIISIDCNRTFFILFWVAFAIALLYAISTMKLHYDNKIILIRKIFLIVNIMTLVVMAMILFGNMKFTEALPLIAAPFAIYFAMLSQLGHRRIITDIVIIMFSTIVTLIPILGK